MGRAITSSIFSVNFQSLVQFSYRHPRNCEDKEIYFKNRFYKRVGAQPIYVGDLVNFIIIKCLSKSNTFELAGPMICSFEEIFNIILNSKKKKRFYFPVPFFIATSLAFVLEMLPNPLTRDQIKLLKKIFPIKVSDTQERN